MKIKDIINKEVKTFGDEISGFRKYPGANFAFTQKVADQFSNLSIKEIVEDPYILDMKWDGEQGLYPELLDVLIELDEKRKAKIINTFIFTGSVGAGKCNKYNSLCITPDGILTMEEAYKKSTKLMAESGIKEIVSRVDEGEQEGIELTFNNGIISHTTPHHRLRVWTEDAKIEWKYVRDIKIGDYIVFTPNNNEIWGTRTEIDGFELTERRCEVLGLWVAEGRHINGKTSELISGEDRKELDSLFKRANIWFRMGKPGEGNLPYQVHAYPGQRTLLGHDNNEPKEQP